LAKIFPFQPYRYAPAAGALQELVTQPYDKISPAMQAKYLAASPNNLCHVLLGPRRAEDTADDNVYTRAARIMNDWIASGVWVRDQEPGMFAYFQEFVEPDTGERLVRKGFIALGEVVPYSAGVVYRHEQTLTGPKADRTELLRHTNTHFEPIFMLYPDAAGEIDALLDAGAAQPPIAEVTDEYGALHRMWKLGAGERIQQLMADKRLIIADGHHRYETALGVGVDRMMMSFVNMRSAGLRILATHRLVSGIEVKGFVEAVAQDFDVRELARLDELKRAWVSAGDRSIIGAAIGQKLYALEDRVSSGALDVRVLHERLLGGVLGIGEAAVRDEKHIRYMRGIDAAVEEARKGAAQIAFLLKPTSVEQVEKISFAGGVMPQKSTDFYPKLLSGLLMYKLDSVGQASGPAA
jgi:uncharacterized protein (DUF1015 family)